ncbi:MAG: hypothetical protein A2287_08485 [Candidatus Melainabacteria bacterium RIFOXYA12_FULL_32_12]|nr:MAG: hypothetical protein A2287_08485 [Candidatus Melainabacteria bacterium RIFOXYA12_FULL_32_12]
MEPSLLQASNFPGTMMPQGQMQQMPGQPMQLSAPSMPYMLPPGSPMPCMQAPHQMAAPPSASSVPPSTSAVSINIIGPQAYGGSPAQNQQPQNQLGSPYNYPSAPLYNYNSAPYYNMPQSSLYAPQQASYPMPPMYPTASAQMQPVSYPTQQQYPYPQQMAQEIPQQMPEQVQQQQQQVQQQAPQQQPEQQEPAPKEPAVDVQSVNAALKSPNLDEQFMAIQKIAETGQTNKEQSASLLNEQTFRALADLVATDTNALQGQEKEKANLNKMTGMWALAILQKNFREALDNETKTQGLPSLTINEVPGIVPIVNNLKSNPNPTIRESAISALNYLAKPEDAQVLASIFSGAAKDKDPSVKAAAKQALQNLQQQSQQVPQQQNVQNQQAA